MQYSLRDIHINISVNCVLVIFLSRQAVFPDIAFALGTYSGGGKSTPGDISLRRDV
jgi:hypothetical protein